MYKTTATWASIPSATEVSDQIDPKVSEMQAAGLTDGVGTQDWTNGPGILPMDYLRTWTTEEAAQQFKTFLETLPTAPTSVVISEV